MVDYQYPRLTTPILLLLLAALFGALAAYGTKMPDWLRVFLVACAFVFGFFGVLSLLDWIAARFADRLESIQAAKVYSAVMVANALHGLSQAQTEIVAKFGMVEARGLMGENQIFWTIQAPGGDIPWECIADFVMQSDKTKPHLWPISQHDIFSADPYRWQDFRGYGGAEQLCTRITDLFIHRGWAEKESGPYAARLIVPLNVVAKYFRVEDDDGRI
jgi:hypothetical protein